MRQAEVPGQGHWATLVRVPWAQDPTNEDIVNIRVICKLAESVFTAWLGGYGPRVHQDLVNLGPYSRGALDWKGDCSRNALLEELHLRINPARRAERLNVYCKRSYRHKRVKLSVWKAATSPDELQAWLATQRRYFNSWLSRLSTEQREAYNATKLWTKE